MRDFYDYFEMISKIPRCSFETEAMREKIIEIAKSFDFEIQEDKSGNVLCKKGEPKVCLQAHYDMVCIGDAKNIELIQEGDTLRAKNSTLGADNGMGMAIMFYCMQKYENLECLFTNDEEVGLIGASFLELQITSPNLLNLDGEEESEIYVGCAGGVDIISTMELHKEALHVKEKVFSLSVENLAGGHSGVDIDKDIDSAIKVLARQLANLQDIRLIEISGGEMRNSIAKSAFATIACKQAPKITDSRVYLKELERRGQKVIENSKTLIYALDSFAQGIRSFDREYMIPSKSINIGVIKIDEQTLRIECAARAMDEKALHVLANETKSHFLLAGFSVRTSDGHEPWKPQIGPFAKEVKKVMQKTYPGIAFHAIHAGLECGILIKRQHKEIEAVSIGPTIRYPHSIREECALDSVKRICSVVEEIIQGN